MAFHRHLLDSELGRVRQTKRFQRDLVTEECARDLVLDEAQPDCRPIASSIQSLRLEADGRFLLLGCGAGELYVYDHQDLESPGGSKGPIASANRDGSQTTHHGQGVCLAEWYCQDCGIFNVGSFDGSVGVWDTNQMECVHRYDVSDCCNVIASGIFPETAPLIAVGTKSDQLRLLDIRQAANTHTLVGHREQVSNLIWSNSSAHGLYSADVEGCIYFWDLRYPVPVAELGSKETPKIVGAMGRSLEKKRLRRPMGMDDRRVESIVQSSFGTVQRSANGSAAHSSAVNSMLISPKGKYLFTYGQGKLKVWDVMTNQFVSSATVGRARRANVFARFDMAMNDLTLDRNQRLFVGLDSKLFSMYPEAGNSLTHWPSGHDIDAVSVHYNRVADRYYSSGMDGMWRVWKYKDTKAVEPTLPPGIADFDQDEWD